VPALGKPDVGQRVLYPPRYNIRYPVAATGSPTPSKPVIHHSVEELLMMMENNIPSPELATPSLTSSVQTPELRRTRRLKLDLSLTFVLKGSYVRKRAPQSAGHWDARPPFGPVLATIIRH